MTSIEHQANYEAAKTRVELAAAAVEARDAAPVATEPPSREAMAEIVHDAVAGDLEQAAAGYHLEVAAWRLNRAEQGDDEADVLDDIEVIVFEADRMTAAGEPEAEIEACNEAAITRISQARAARSRAQRQWDSGDQSGPRPADFLSVIAAGCAAGESSDPRAWLEALRQYKTEQAPQPPPRIEELRSQLEDLDRLIDQQRADVEITDEKRRRGLELIREQRRTTVLAAAAKLREARR